MRDRPERWTGADLLVSDPEATFIAGGQSLMPFVTIRGQIERCAPAAVDAKPVQRLQRRGGGAALGPVHRPRH
jgi:hypothetical protein